MKESDLSGQKIVNSKMYHSRFFLIVWIKEIIKIHRMLIECK